ncbi:MAG: hypothetical protein AB1644_05990 [Candidatus Zixiibacteriota bacterium]
MSRLIILVGVALLAIPVLSFAQPRDKGFGMGAVMGEPTAINGKVWTGYSTAVDFALAWSQDNDRDFNTHVDYLFHDYGVFNVTRGKLPLYYGVGGRVKDASDARVGLRVPVGLNYLFVRAPLDAFIEVAPVLDVVPETEMDFEAGIGMRFYFR